MSQRANDEAEHRRGLVLGLTLAEVLLLLLFLVMLALAALFQEVERERQVLESERDKLKATLNVLFPRGVPENEDLRGQLSALFPESAQGSKLADVLKQAAEYDPNAPVEFLRRAVNVLVELGPSLQPEAARKMADAAKSKGEHDWPPIITISGAEEHFFLSGSADLPPGLEQHLAGSVTDELLENIEKYKVDVIEVVGHTDEQPIILRASNLDQTLLNYLRGEPVEMVVPADNAGLGLARAVSVARELSSDERLKRYKILPLSGGQLIDLNDKVSSGLNPLPAEFRRRIEIRLRRSPRQVVDPDRSTTEQQTAAASPQKSWQQSIHLANETLDPIRGIASIIDGDTIDIANKRIRIWGVDAIEKDQKCFDAGQEWDCAAEAKRKLSTYLSGKESVCHPVERDQYGRIVAKCTANGSDIGSWLVSQGLALDYPHYSDGTYQTEQAKAKTLRLGIWRGQFVMPWIWRNEPPEATGSLR